MSHATSDSPPPFPTPRPRSDLEHQVLSECSAMFAGINTTLKTVGREMGAVRDEVINLGKTQTGLETTISNLSRELREEIKPTIRDLPDRLTKSFAQHSGDCPARRRAMKKAESTSSDDIDVRRFRGDATGTVPLSTPAPGSPLDTVPTTGGRFIRNTENGHFEIPRPIFWLGAGIGTAVASLGYLLNIIESIPWPF